MTFSVTLPNTLKVWWDGLTRIYIDAPPSFRGQTQVINYRFPYSTMIKMC